jgi:hypothetical protein
MGLNLETGPPLLSTRRCLAGPLHQLTRARLLQFTSLPCGSHAAVPQTAPSLPTLGRWHAAPWWVVLFPAPLPVTSSAPSGGLGANPPSPVLLEPQTDYALESRARIDLVRCCLFALRHQPTSRTPRVRRCFFGDPLQRRGLPHPLVSADSFPLGYKSGIVLPLRLPSSSLLPYIFQAARRPTPPEHRIIE